ncbi:hypothetical protein GQ43DRAFT_484248 [Delitschia confertaspora ATCC 74209]|uniref:F-box domain-containing protein n=1 Tax=Delitschia confertaspora ATCC 74209 TaxID=1513339 RepID=A0A9P4JDM2_9PLEO|nr:hypothetical protein GQ43DRAFT_484248 [Delitschia confertaspora ATCC 74209]
MDSSSLAADHSATTSSPSPFEDDINSRGSPSLDDVQIMSPGEEADFTPDNQTEIALPPGGEMEHHTPPYTTYNLPKGKEKECTSTKGRNPLRLLDLPVDILKEIIHQLPHTNDLTSLALCHSALHRLTIPYIYSRFDIVWPDESAHTEPRTGVDALTYGLATLVMAEESFPHQNRDRQTANRYPSRTSKSSPTPYPVPRRRFGNYYAQHTRKFSLGNGPPTWVQEYMIAKEGGKMLGTLVALAVARMINLETFVWDMPTGVLRDVWLALSSLADRTDGEDCRLERIWIRWHDNSQLDSPGPVPPPPMILNNVPAPPNTTQPSGAAVVQAPAVIPAPITFPSTLAIDRVEHPTFSVIPPLKSLSVLDIDELPYLDEMSILIARSQKKLCELRVGIAPHARNRYWVTAWDGDGIQQVDYSTTSTLTSSIGEKRLGGVLGVLVGRVYNLRQNEDSPNRTPNSDKAAGRSATTNTSNNGQAGIPNVLHSAHHDRESEHNTESESTIQEGVSLLSHEIPHESEHAGILGTPMAGIPTRNGIVVPVSTPEHETTQGSFSKQKNENVASEPILNNKLKLETVELERVPLSVAVFLKAFDWSLLTNLTLLNCNNHEHLWKSLRRTYTPRVPCYPIGSPASKAYKASYTLRTEYSLNIKKIHTNTVSPSLISFLKETLAPNSLEVLFLQEGQSYVSTVTVEAIYRGPLRRHRGSLRKLMIDSSEKGPDGHATSSSRWRRWMLNREIITFITSGKMNKLREWAASIDYRDWHYLLQRLPLIPHVRSLYIPFIADHAHGNNIDPRELALQIVDIVHLRPEVEVCYIGIMTKCFEILENRPSNYDLRNDGMGADGPLGGGYVVHDPPGLMSDEESETTEDEEEEDLDDGAGPVAEAEDTESEISDEHDDSDGDDSFLQEEQKGPKFRIREILFYENIDIFAARHGRL